MHRNVMAARRCAPVVLGCFGQICTAHAQKLPFPASDQNSDIAIRFSNSDPDFLKESNTLAIK